MLGELPVLYPILDASVLPAEAPVRTRFLAETVKELAAAGVEWLQYRNKLGSDAEVLADASILRAAASAPSASLRLILNDRAHLVLAAGFDGLHIGQLDLPAAQARACIGPGKLLGLSTHNPAQVIAASQAPVDYLAIGPIFPTTSKADAEPVVSLAGLAHARTLTPGPLVAIGGITVGNAAQVRAAGASSLAVLSAVFPPGASPARAAKLAKDFLALFR